MLLQTQMENGRLRILNTVLPLWTAAVFVLFLFYGTWPVFSSSTWAHYIPPVWLTGPAALAGHLKHLSQLICFWLIAAGCGRVILRKIFKLLQLNWAESIAFSFAVGSGVLSYAILIVAAMKWLTAPVVAGMTGMGLVGAVWLNRDLIARMGRPQESRASEIRSGHIAAVLLAVWILSLNLFYALGPEIYYDSLVYHLALPQLYRLSQGLVPTPENLLSGIPFLQQMLYAWALLFGDEILARLVHWSFGVALACAFFGLCMRHRKSALGWFIGPVFLSAPIFGLNLSAAAVDAALTTYVFLSVYALSLFQETQKRGMPLLILSALLGGIALSLKYTIWPFLPVVVLCLALLRVPPKKIWVFAIVSLCCLAPVVLRNLLFYGNPIFPYFHEWFQPNAAYPVNWREMQEQGWGRHWPSIVRSPTTLLELILHPFFITFRGSTSADFVGPFFLAVLPMLAYRRPAEERIWLCMCLGLWLSWWPISSLPRFFLPGLSLLAAAACVSVPAEAGRATNRVMGLILTLMIVANTASSAQFSCNTDSWNYLIGGESKSSYLREPHATYPTPHHSAVEWINAQPQSGGRVMLIGDPRAAYLERPFLASPRSSSDPLYVWLKHCESEDQLKQIVDREQVRYWLINVAEAIRRPKDTGLSLKDLERLELFFQRYTVLRFRERSPNGSQWSEVYEIVPRASNPEEQKFSLVEWLRYRMQKDAS